MRVGKAVLDSLMYTMAWASTYISGQVFYNAATLSSTESFSDPELGNFATYNPEKHMFTGIVPKSHLPGLTLFAFLFNVGLAVLLYLMVKLQLFCYNKQAEIDAETLKIGGTKPLVGPLVGLGVILAKLLDAFADGVTFFTTNMIYLVLLSAFVYQPNKDKADEKVANTEAMRVALPFAIVLTVVIALLVALSEGLPVAWYTRSNRYTPDKKRTVELLGDWWLANWAWLIGFGGWTAILVLLQEFFRWGLFAWWFVTIMLLVILILVMVIVAYRKTLAVSRRKDSSTLPLTISDAASTDSTAQQSDWVASKKILKGRLITLVVKGWNWLFGIGLYFSLQRSFPVFSNGLGAKSVNYSSLFGMVIGTTVVLFGFIVLLELLHQHKKILETSPEVKAGIFPSFVCLCVPRTLRRTFDLAIFDNFFKTLRVTCAYIIGKAWLAIVTSWVGIKLMGHESVMLRDPALFYWYLVPITQVFATFFGLLQTIYDLKTQEAHAENHGHYCVCVACAPEYFDDELTGRVISEAEQKERVRRVSRRDRASVLQLEVGATSSTVKSENGKL